MELIEGIKVYIEDQKSSLHACGGALELSAGIIPADRSPKASLYADPSFLPRTPWHKPSAQETSILCASLPPTAAYGKWIALIQTPDGIFNAFASFREAIASGASLRELRKLLDSPLGQEAKAQATQYAMSLAHPVNPKLEAPLVHISPADAVTTTKDRESRFIGLHVDSWYRIELEKRLYAPNRLSINLGDEVRYLLYINLPLQTIAHSIGEALSKGELKYGVGTGLRTAFMQRRNDYPVVKLAVKPGEAYIAPTENMIHDGSTIGQTHVDLQFNVRGHFVPLSASNVAFEIAERD